MIGGRHKGSVGKVNNVSTMIMIDWLIIWLIGWLFDWFVDDVAGMPSVCDWLILFTSSEKLIYYILYWNLWKFPLSGKRHQTLHLTCKTHSSYFLNPLPVPFLASRQLAIFGMPEAETHCLYGLKPLGCLKHSKGFIFKGKKFLHIHSYYIQHCYYKGLITIPLNIFY